VIPLKRQEDKKMRRSHEANAASQCICEPPLSPAQPADQSTKDQGSTPSGQVEPDHGRISAQPGMAGRHQPFSDQPSQGQAHPPGKQKHVGQVHHNPSKEKEPTRSGEAFHEITLSHYSQRRV